MLVIPGALHPDVTQGKGSFLSGGLAFPGVWRLDDGGQGVAAAVAGLDVQQMLPAILSVLHDGDGGVLHRQLAAAGEHPGF